MRASVSPPRKVTTRVLVVSDGFGRGGGAPLATALLCERLRAIGTDVTCFAVSVDRGDLPESLSYRLVKPLVTRGSRWRLPGKSLIWRVRLHAWRRGGPLIIVVGMTYLAALLLESELADQTLVWELTNANAGNKFVSRDAVRLLGRGLGVISPAPAIDENIRAVYGYNRALLRLPFWVRADDAVFARSPDAFDCDFLFLGRREKEKGLRELLAAVAEVVRVDPSVRVTIGGLGCCTEFIKLAEQLSIVNNVDFPTYRTSNEASAALARARALVLPSYHEGYPLVILEACKSSIPFIATAVGGVPDMARGTDAGLLIPPQDVGALARALIQIRAESSEQYEERRRAAFSLFEQLTGGQRIEKFLHRILEKSAVREDRR